MIKRRLNIEIRQSLEAFPVVCLLGSRQVGKTTLAKVIQGYFKDSIYLDLELPSDLQKLNYAEDYLLSYQDKLVIIDEIQRMPKLFSLIRSLVDRKRKAGRFLILGSASPTLLKQASETLAGRILYYELSPFDIHELGQKNWKLLWLRGGYPDSFLASDDLQSISWRNAFIRAFLERDIPQLGLMIPSIQLRRFWTMIAHVNGNLWNGTQIANSLGVTAPTMRRYLDILSDTFIARQILPYFANVRKRLVKSPKVYLRDTGLLHALLNINSYEDLLSTPYVGASWEGFVVEQILAILPKGWNYYFYRTSAGAEIDLILEKNYDEVIPIEIKFSASPKLTKGFWNALADLHYKKAFVVYTGDEIYNIRSNVTMLPFSRIKDILKK